MSNPEPLHPSRPPLRLGLHRSQLEVAEDQARFKVVCCGRQWGKTLLGAALCVKEALKGGKVWWVGPSFPVGELGMQVINQLCRQIEGASFERRPVWRTSLPGGGSIQMRSADNPDSLRGATLDGVVFDEAATAKSEAWSTLRPTLSVRQGWALFISTPKGLNWFHDLFEDADQWDDWARWRFPSVDNPYLPPSDVGKAREEMSSLVFSQEFEAEFISHGSGMFHADWIQHYYTRFEGEERFYLLGEEAIAASACTTFHTVDLAWSMEERADYTVISTWAVTPKRHLILVDVNRGHFEGPDIVPKLRQAYQTYGGTLIVEKASRQMSIIQEAERSGLPIHVVRAEKDKVARALPATARMERKTVWFPPASTPWYPDIEQELLAFPAGRHDDFVDTLSYAVLQVADMGDGEIRWV
jgi:predicted phage terminase large subunit-like protein